MKTYGRIILFTLIAGLFFSACRKKEKGDIVPENVKVNLSDAISVPDFDKKNFILADSIASGRDLYQHLRTLVYVGEFSADMVNSALRSIQGYNINKPINFSYTSDLDNRTKTVVVKEMVQFEGTAWDYEMIISDDLTGKALALYWNLNPLKVVVIMHTKAWNYRTIFMRQTLIRIDYSEIDRNFDRTMLVQITGMDSTSLNYMNKLKMFVGQKDEIVYFYGNSIHPNAYFVDASHTGGRAWSFKGKNNINLDIAVARCALPPTTLPNTGMPDLWTQYSMDKVLESEITTAYVTVTQPVLDYYLQNARGAAYFVGLNGFVSNDNNIPNTPGFTTEFINLSGFDPWAPLDITNMTIKF